MSVVIPYRPVRLFVLLLIAVVATAAHAQWTQPNASGHINNTNSGFIGIGTTTPAYKLDVLAPSVRMGDGGSFHLVFNVPASSSVAARLFAGGSERLTILGNGYVGIGTTAPVSSRRQWIVPFWTGHRVREHERRSDHSCESR